MPMEYYLLLGGVALLIGEAAVPGFGLLGIGGMICVTVGGFFVMGGGMPALLVLLGIYLLLALFIGFCCFYLPKESKWNPFVLWDKQRNSAGYTGGQDLSPLLGRQGITLTTLRPAGTVSMDGQRLDVSSLGEYIEKNVPVTIVKVEGSKIFVEKTKE